MSYPENNEDSADSISVSFDKFCEAYKEVLFFNGLSPHFLRSLHEKLENEIFDAGDYFLLTPTEEGGSKLKVIVAKEEGIKASDSKAVFLIDHAWTYRAFDARKQLCETPGLLPRLSQMMGYSIHGEMFHPDDDIVSTIRKEMWKYNQTYAVNASGSDVKNKLPIWYILDEFGSCIQHSDSPTFAVIPFYYHPKQISYSIMWPLTDLDYADEVTRDFANFEKDSLLRKCKLLPWIEADFSDVPEKTSCFLDKHYDSRFSYAGETLPERCERHKVDKQRLKIFMGVNSEFLTDVTSFETVDDANEADVIFDAHPIRDFKLMSEERPNVLINQFPGETILFCKDFFMDIAKRSTEDDSIPFWYPVTYDLYSQLPQFISHFKKRKSWAKDKNVWICKPWNMASMDTTVSNDLNEIIRIRETEVPKIVSKYIEDPVLLLSREAEAKVKFDIRIYVLVSSVEPRRIYVCESFYVRHSLKSFSLDMFDDVRTHFTALRSEEDNSPITYAIAGTTFVQQFEEQYPNHRWKDIAGNIHLCLSKFFKSATSRAPPYGVGHYSNSRAIYGFDVMLEWQFDDAGEQIMQPILLECNYISDLTSICSFYPSFLSDALRFLFLEDDSCKVTDISNL